MERESKRAFETSVKYLSLDPLSSLCTRIDGDSIISTVRVIWHRPLLCWALGSA